MASEADRPRAVPTEEIDSQIAELLQFAKDAGAKLGQLPGRTKTSTIKFPGATEIFEQSLRQSLEDEIIPVTEIQAGGIEQSELHREVVKKALVGLKLSTLKRIARDKRLPVSGSIEELATRIGRMYEWDEEEVARLILSNEEEPVAERGHVTRVFPLADNYNQTEANERLKSVVGRYVRTGVARWFLFEDTRNVGKNFEISGSYKTYQASVDEVNESVALSAVPHEKRVRIWLDGSSLLQVSGASAMPAKGALLGFEYITGVRAKGYLPFAERGAKDIAGTFHPTSEFLLDLLFNRVGKSNLKNINLTVARFNVRTKGDNKPLSDSTVAERRPELKAVRFEGEHLLDSIAACRLLALDGRAVVEISFLTSILNDDESTRGRFPVRVTAENDHVAIQTGLGSGEHELSVQVHRQIVADVSASLSEGILDANRMKTLFERVKDRAKASHPPEVANILFEDSD